MISSLSEMLIGCDARIRSVRTFDSMLVLNLFNGYITRSATPDTKPNGTTGLQPQMNLSHVNERALYIKTLYMSH